MRKGYHVSFLLVTKATEYKGTDPIWSQICSSLLQSEGKKKKNSSLCKREKITIYHIDLRDLRERWCFQAFDTKVLSVTTDERRQE